MPRESLEIMMGILPRPEGQLIFKPTWRMMRLLPRMQFLAYSGGVVLVLLWLLNTEFNHPLFPYYIPYSVLINILFIVAMILEVMQIIDMRRKYGKAGMSTAMDAFPMG
jgi:hypothetical protein